MKKSILFILHFTPPIHGSSMVGEQIRDSKLLSESFDGHFINLNTSKKMNEIGRIGITKLFRYLGVLWNVFVALLFHKPKISYIAITAKGLAFYKDAIIVLLVKLFGVKTIFHMHNKGVSTRQDRFIDNILYKLVFNNSEVIILSKHLYPDIKKYVNKNRLHICFNGVQDFDPKDYKNQNQLVEILFLSNLIESKGVYILLEACKLLKKNKISFKCKFVGGEGDVSEDQLNSKIKKLHLQNCVDYVGKKYGRDKEEFFSKADIFAFPTYYHNECFPLVLLEAMQFSLPIVSTFEGGISDIVEDGKTGFLVTQQDVQALANKLEALILNHKLRIKMGIAGRKLFDEKLTISHFERRMHEILNSVII